VKHLNSILVPEPKVHARLLNVEPGVRKSGVEVRIRGLKRSALEYPKVLGE
jgi:hypothetical protein